MVELKSFPFDSIVDDREYPASIFRNYFYKFLSNGVYFGSYKGYGDYSMKVMPQSGLNITVKKGAGILRGLDFELEEDTTLAVSISLEQERKDMVVVRADDTLEERRTTVYIKEGTDEDFPELERTTDVYEICLAKISVGDTVSTITIDDIEDTRRDSDYAGIVTSLIDIDIQDVLDDITTKKDQFFENLGITTQAQAEQFISDLETYINGKYTEADNLVDELEDHVEEKSQEADAFIERLRAMLEELSGDLIPSELVTVESEKYESERLDGALEEIADNISDLNSNKVNKETGKSLISDTEITRLANVDNYDDTAISGRVTTLENGKDLKGSFSIATTDWTSDTTWGDYTVKATISVTGVTANDIADIYFDNPENAGEIGATGVNTVANGIEIYAESTPESALTGKYKVAKVVVANE